MTNTLQAKLYAYFSGNVGVARRDATPPLGIYSRNWGAATMDIATGLHKPFFATALAMQAEGDMLLLVALDGGWWQSREDEWFIRGAVMEALGLEASQVMINLSHTHAGPPLVRENKDKPGGELIEPYFEMLRESVVSASREAVQSLQPGLLTWATGLCNLATNRDLKDPAGDRYLTGFNPTEQGDPTVLVGRITDASGQIIATLVNYACHPTTLAWQNERLSPDYVGAMREVVEGYSGGAPCLFLLGACGELAPAHQYVGDPAVADKHGRRLGLSACAALEGMLPPGQTLAFQGPVESGAPLAVWHPEERSDFPALARFAHFTIPLEIKPDFPSLNDLGIELSACESRVLAERLSRKLRVRKVIGDEPAYPLPVWIWRLGDTFFIGYPAEAYSRLQVELRRAFPESAIVVMNVVNGSIGYLPPEGLYREDIYSVWQTPFAKGCLEKLIERCMATLKELASASGLAST